MTVQYTRERRRREGRCLDCEDWPVLGKKRCSFHLMRVAKATAASRFWWRNLGYGLAMAGRAEWNKRRNQEIRKAMEVEDG